MDSAASQLEAAGEHWTGDKAAIKMEIVAPNPETAAAKRLMGGTATRNGRRGGHQDAQTKG